MTDPQSLRRHLRREFVRAHHPDRGGDPEVFVAGLEALERESHRDAGHGGAPGGWAGPVSGEPVTVRVTVVRRRRWPDRVATALRQRIPGRSRPSRVR